jgi:putative phosphoesterase
MPGVAVITDIHANLPALEASLDWIDSAGLIADRGIPTVYGNYDWAIARDAEDCGCAYVTKHDREIGQLSVDWTLDNTDPTSKDFMRGLPFDLRFEFGGKRVRLVHGSPRKVNEYLFEDKPARTFERIAAGADCDVLVFGHTHKPWVHEYGGVLFVNCGSVGKPKDGDARAAFAVFDADDGRIQVDILRVDYDAESVAEEVRRVGLPDELATKLVAAI